LWYLGATAFVFSLIVSFRQQLKLEELAPYILVSTPLMVKTFLSSYRIRLREFRKKYRLLLTVAMSLLLFSTLTIYMNKYLYLVIDKQHKHFVYKNHIVKELADGLKALNINAISTSNVNLQNRLKFYGIGKDLHTHLYTHKPFAHSELVTISYIGVDVAHFYVTKLYK
jgi:hypothetical protein